MNLPLPKRNKDGSYSFVGGMAVDGDGANGFTSAPVYAPAGYLPKPLDYLANAGHLGDWWGIVTDAKGNPVKQRRGDPMSGAYVSPTTYEWMAYNDIDPLRYVDANAVPYIVIPSHWRREAKGVVLGCRATVKDSKTGRTVEAGVFDLGPKAKAGEGSIALCRMCGVPASPKNGGTSEKRFTYTFFPGVPAVINGVEYDLIPA